MTEAQMFEKSFERPSNYFKLSSREQWKIDSNLEILGWGGRECIHGTTCKECEKRYQDHYKIKKEKK
jgi:hypothetical protein